MNVSVASPVPAPAAGQGKGKTSAEGAMDFMAVLQSMTSSGQEAGSSAVPAQAESSAEAPLAEMRPAELPVAVPAPLSAQASVPAPPQAVPGAAQAQEPASPGSGPEPIPEAESPAAVQTVTSGADGHAGPEGRTEAADENATAALQTADEISWPPAGTPESSGPVQAQSPTGAAAQPQTAPAAAPVAVPGLQLESKVPSPATQPVPPAPGAPGPANVRVTEPVVALAGVQAAPALTRPVAFRIPEPVQVAARDSEAAPSVQAAPVPAQAPVSQTAATAAPVPVHAPAPAQQPLHTQLAKPMFTLAAAENGEHVMTMKVTPEELGTVTVRAVIGPEGVRMELFATEAGREAVKAIMPDLRRDMAGAGFNASLDLGSGPRPDGQASGGERRGPTGQEARTAPEPAPREQPSPVDRRMFTDGSASLDVLA